MNKIALGKALKAERTERKFGLKELAVRAGMESNRLADVEAGRYNPNFFTIYRITKALRMDMDDLVQRMESIAQEEG